MMTGEMGEGSLGISGCVSPWVDVCGEMQME